VATRPVNPQFVSLDEYDVLVYPGFLRRTVRLDSRLVPVVPSCLPAPLVPVLALGFRALCAVLCAIPDSVAHHV